jgi:hypothetical protein
MALQDFGRVPNSRMKSLRKLMEDRWSGGLLVATMIYFLAIQGLAGAIAQGSAAGSLQDPAFICSSFADHGRTGNPTTPSEDGDHHAFCAILCQASFARAAALPGAPPTIQRVALFREVEAVGELLLPQRNYERLHVAEARAPPHLA